MTLWCEMKNKTLLHRKLRHHDLNERARSDARCRGLLEAVPDAIVLVSDPSLKHLGFTLAQQPCGARHRDTGYVAVAE